jgi:hypothetical protein
LHLEKKIKICDQVTSTDLCGNHNEDDHIKNDLISMLTDNLKIYEERKDSYEQYELK